MYPDILKGRKIKAETPLYDHSGARLTFLTREQVIEKLDKPGIYCMLKRRTVLGLRFDGPDPALSMDGSQAREGVENPHKRDTYYNPAGVWTHNFMSSRLRPLFETVMVDCGAKRVPSQKAIPPAPLVRRPIQPRPVPCLPLRAA